MFWKTKRRDEDFTEEIRAHIELEAARRASLVAPTEVLNAQYRDASRDRRGRSNHPAAHDRHARM